jgi:ADP-heptose:LPS heptosyltransferase
MKNKSPVIIISRTDSIGDVVLTLPMAGILKQEYPHAHIYFLGQKYTQPVVELCKHIDGFLDWSEIKKKDKKEQISFFKNLSADRIIHVFPVKEIAELSKKANIPQRTATRNRWYHWLYCNQLVKLSRRKSTLHEAQLNMILLPDFSDKNVPSLREIRSFYGTKPIEPLNDNLNKYLDPKKTNLILHPKSKGSAREWGLENYAKLIEMLPEEDYHILLTGTEDEGRLFRKTLANPYPFVRDLSGKLSLAEFISVIHSADALVACSTGPLHIAAMLNKLAIGIYPPVKPMHPQRWSPIGENAHVLVLDKDCNDCRKSMNCTCIRSVTPSQVMEILG